MKITKAPAPREIIDYFKEEFDLEFEVKENYNYDYEGLDYKKYFTISLPDKVVSPFGESNIFGSNITHVALSVNRGLLHLAKQLSYQEILVDGVKHQVPFLTHTKNVKV